MGFSEAACFINVLKRWKVSEIGADKTIDSYAVRLDFSSL